MSITTYYWLNHHLDRIEEEAERLFLLVPVFDLATTKCRILSPMCTSINEKKSGSIQ